MNEIELGIYRATRVFGNVTPEIEKDVVALWTQYGALDDPAEGPRRAQQVFAIARNPAGALAAVCTLFTADFGTPPQPHYHYRMFIRPEDRKSGLAFGMMSMTRKMLVADYKPGDAVVGLVVVLESPVLRNPVVRQQFQDAGWESEGADPRGFDIWRRRFDKKPG